MLRSLIIIEIFYNNNRKTVAFMLIQGNINSQRDNILIKKYKDWISQGICEDEILVILLNTYKKNIFTENLIKNIPSLNTEKLRIFTVYGLCYNSFKDNTEYIKSLIKCNDTDTLNLSGLEISQYIFKQSIKEADFSDYISKVNLLHQLFRRYSLIVQNNLSNKEVERLSGILNETFYKEAQNAINTYKIKTIEYKSFDYLRQLAIFPQIYKNTNYFDKIKYLIVNDADEISYAIWQFIEYLTPKLKDYIIAYDKNGSSRCGYLCAYKSGINNFKKNNPQNINIPETDKTAYTELAETLFTNIKNGEKTRLKDIRSYNSVRRLDMIDSVFEEIKSLVNSGVNPNEISVVTPISDEILKQTINEKNSDINFQIISGNEKLADIKIIKYTLTILKIINDINVPDYEIKTLLIELLGIPFKKCYKVIESYRKNKCFRDFQFENPIHHDKYTKLKSIIESLKRADNSLSNQIKSIYTNIIKDEHTKEETLKYDFLLKEAKDFETAFSKDKAFLIKEFITQTENSVISENPANAFSIKNNAVIISTPQKIIDYELKTKYQLWLDISSSEWFKQDTGTLYNAWVFNRDRNKPEYNEFEDNINCTRDKTARIIRKLILCAKKEIKLYSSIYDNSGNENFGGLNDYFEIKEEKKTEFKIIPREDQKPVLEYTTGKMGIMAVPGAGKTTILLALIIKLLNSDIPAENIFVLTYMESAAKNFKERLKLGIKNPSSLPNISTIHGLALRIIKENGNYIKAGLDEDFEICDDNTKEKILKEIFYKLKINDDKYDNYIKSISIIKLSGIQEPLSSKYQDIQEFYRFFNEYNIALKKQNLIDYDDMLRYAVMILKQNKETAKYYQNLCRYIIEDEAQDSSEIQQTLINILSAKHKNIVRCGDINQSITSTFTNSDLKSFKDFVEANQKVEMVSSQRCSKPIYELANNIIDKAFSDKEKQNAFYKIKMQGTPNNPQSVKNPEFLIFENEKEEKEFILNKIKEIKNKAENISVAILLRLNSQVNEYNNFLAANGIQTTIRTDCLAQKRIFKYIYTILNIIENPLNNNLISELAKLYINDRNSQNREEEIIKQIQTSDKPFIKLNPDAIKDEILSQMYWDVDYWLNNSNTDIDDTALRIGLFYSKTASDKSNTYIAATFIKHIKNQNESTCEILKKIDYYAQKPMNAYKFFEDEKQNEGTTVNIMTVHKSKGDEFDYVFIPMLSEENYPTEKANVKLKTGNHFTQTIKSIVQKCPIQTPDESKQEQIEETLRLLYVGVTRAKQELTMTVAKQYKMRKNSHPNLFFKI